MNINVIWVLIAVVVIVLGVAVVQGFQIADMNTKITEMAAKASGSSIDTTGWTEDEKMQYEHHGILPARVQSISSSSSGQVGKC